MWRNDAQANRAIRVLLAGCFSRRIGGVDAIWTDDGPTHQAFCVIEGRSPMSRGEKTLVRIAFDFWNGEGKATIADTLNLDGPNLDAVAALMRAYNLGGDGIEAFIAGWCAR